MFNDMGAHVSKKYRKLTEFLARRTDHTWVAQFSEIERILGFSLPESARTYQAWWSNQMRSQSLGWQSAGWKTTDLDIQNLRVTFVYVGSNEASADATPPLRTSTTASGLTLADAKAGLAITFGVEPSQIEITIKA